MTKDEALKMCLEYIETNAQGSKFAILIKEALAQTEEKLITVDELESFAALVASAAVRETSAEYRLGWNDGQIAEREAILAVIGDNQCECRCSEVVRDRGQAT